MLEVWSIMKSRSYYLHKAIDVVPRIVIPRSLNGQNSKEMD
jgi:hypothetical protein